MATAPQRRTEGKCIFFTPEAFLPSGWSQNERLLVSDAQASATVSNYVWSSRGCPATFRLWKVQSAPRSSCMSLAASVFEEELMMNSRCTACFQMSLADVFEGHMGGSLNNIFTDFAVRTREHQDDTAHVDSYGVFHVCNVLMVAEYAIHGS